MRRLILCAVWLATIVVVVGFFLPWAELDVDLARSTETLGTTVTGWLPLEKLKEAVNKTTKAATRTIADVSPVRTQAHLSVSGWDVPRLVHREDSRTALAVVELIFGPQQLEAKSQLVYLVPFLALICAGLMAMRPRVAAAIVALIGGGIGGVGWWKLTTTELSNLLVHIEIGLGLWLTIWAFAAIGCLGLCRFLVRPKIAS